MTLKKAFVIKEAWDIKDFEGMKGTKPFSDDEIGALKTVQDQQLPSIRLTMHEWSIITTTLKTYMDEHAQGKMVGQLDFVLSKIFSSLGQKRNKSGSDAPPGYKGPSHTEQY